MFPSTTPTLAADVAEMAKLKAAFGAPLVCFGPHASTVPVDSMARAPQVDAMLVGEPEDAAVALATRADLSDLTGSPERRVASRRRIDRARGRARRICRLQGTCRGRPGTCCRSPTIACRWSARPTSSSRPAAAARTACDFCVAPIHQGHKFREREPKALVDEIEWARRELGVRYFYLWGDTVTLNQKTFGAFCEELIARNLDIQWFGNARADNLTDPAFVHRLKRSGCWMLAMGIESSSPEIRKDMVKRLEEQKIRTGLRQPARRRDQVVRVLHLRLSGRHARVDGRDHRLRDRSRLPTSRTSIRRCPTRARRSTRRCGPKVC